MDFTSKLYLERAENEIQLAEVIFEISNSKNIQEKVFHLSEETTFYSAVITHSYYSIFYSAKAYLLSQGIKTKPPEEHKRTYEEFMQLVKNGVIDQELLSIYETMLTKADVLLEIFKTERRKRGDFTYKKLPQANKKPAEQSLRNSTKFYKNIFNLAFIDDG